MDLDKLIHDKKHFGELENSDVETFLRERKFGSEHLNIEFKKAFPQKSNSKYDIKQICKYIVGLSNEEGGLVIYGVADSIKESSNSYPDYVTGLARNPTLEDLSQWIKDRVHPLISSPAIRFFQVAKRKVAILKIPQGGNKPYCYSDPATRSGIYYKKTPGGIAELTPDEIREFHRSQVIEQSERILRSTGRQELHAKSDRSPQSQNFSMHSNMISPKLEDPMHLGHVSIYCQPNLNCPRFCTTVRERVYITASGCESGLGASRGL